MSAVTRWSSRPLLYSSCAATLIGLPGNSLDLALGRQALPTFQEYFTLTKSASHRTLWSNKPRKPKIY